MSKYAKPLEVATDAALRAGAMLRAEFHRSDGPRGCDGHAPVDRQAELLIRDLLQSEFAWNYRGEELGYTATQADAPLWLVDPHDGTSIFLTGRRGSAVSIAALEDGVPVLGVVYAFGYPDDDGDLICWAEGCGPVRRNGRPIDDGDAAEGREPTRRFDPVVLLWATADAQAQAAWRCVQPARYAALPSIAYRLALVAAGDATAAVCVTGPMGWDYAAGHALLRGVDGVLLNQAGDPISYSRDGQSYASRCFGGDKTLVRTLVPRDWTALFAPVGRARGRGFSLTAPRRGRGVADAGLLCRAQGCLLGQFVGDSLGGCVKSRSATEILSEFPDGVRDLGDGGVDGRLAGQPTDDSELALMLARTLAQQQAFDPDAVRQAYVHWLDLPLVGDNPTTFAALTATLRDATVDRRQSAESAEADSHAIAPLARISPLGIFAAGRPADAFAWARADSGLTHPHRVCQDASAVFAAAIAHAVGSGATAREVYRTALTIAQHAEACDEVCRSVRAAEHAAPPEDERQSAGVLAALQNAFYQVLHAPSFEQGLVATAMAGGDANANTAIAGALLGAVYGRSAIPRRWRRAVLSCRPLRGTPTAHPRHVEFWPVDGLELAEALLLAGQAASSRH